jgi:hypothetical protein
MRNARFWEFINGAPVKLTLTPGQTLHHYQGGPTDEGWSSEATSWRLSNNGRMLRREHTSDGADCDGRVSSGCDAVALPDPADFVPLYYSPELSRPYWRDAGGWQRDRQAEAAGY